MYKVKDKWNGKFYTVVKENQNEVTLEREDKTQFTIRKSELLFNYQNNFEKIEK